MIREILLLGDPRLYETSAPVTRSDVSELAPVVEDLHDTLLEFRRRYGAGRAIAAPQIGVRKRLLYMFIDKPTVFVNPVLTPLGKEQFEVLDDCMSFPNLLVRVMRHRRCRIDYRDMDWVEHSVELEGDLSELLQHEYDHLNGILATMRAVDSRAFVMKRACS